MRGERRKFSPLSESRAQRVIDLWDDLSLTRREICEMVHCSEEQVDRVKLDFDLPNRKPRAKSMKSDSVELTPWPEGVRFEDHPLAGTKADRGRAVFINTRLGYATGV